MNRHFVSFKSGKAVCISADTIDTSNENVMQFFCDGRLVLIASADCIEYIEVLELEKPIVGD